MKWYYDFCDSLLSWVLGQQVRREFFDWVLIYASGYILTLMLIVVVVGLLSGEFKFSDNTIFNMLGISLLSWSIPLFAAYLLPLVLCVILLVIVCWVAMQAFRNEKDH